LLGARDYQRTLEIRLRFRRILLRRHQRDCHIQIDMLGALGQIAGRLADVAGDDYRTLLGKTLHGRLADPARTARNQSDFVLEPRGFPPNWLFIFSVSHRRVTTISASFDFDR
jgi:hypothetical protein